MGLTGFVYPWVAWCKSFRRSVSMNKDYEISALGFGGHSMSVRVNGDRLSLWVDGHRKITMERLQAHVLGMSILEWAKHD